MVLAQIETRHYSFCALGRNNVEAFHAMQDTVRLHLIKCGQIGSGPEERFWEHYPADEIQYNEIDVGKGFVT